MGWFKDKARDAAEIGKDAIKEKTDSYQPLFRRKHTARSEAMSLRKGQKVYVVKKCVNQYGGGEVKKYEVLEVTSLGRAGRVDLARLFLYAEYTIDAPPSDVEPMF